MLDNQCETAQSSSSVKTDLRVASRRRRDFHWGDRVFYWILKLSGWSIIALVLGIIYLLFDMARPALSQFGWRFYVNDDWNPPMDVFGALPVLFGTLMSPLLAILIAGPISVGASLFLTELAPKSLARIAGFLIEMLAAIPSVVYGLWGIFVLSPWMQSTVQPWLVNTLGPETYFARILGQCLIIVAYPVFGLLQVVGATALSFDTYCEFLTSFAAKLFAGPGFGVGMLTAGFVLAIMVTPTITAISREIFMTIPTATKEAALGLGATRWEMIRIAVLRASRAGLVGAVILGLGRALGETMAVTMVIGNRNVISAALMAPGQTMASIIANEYPEASGLHLSALAAVGLGLFAVSLVINSAARLIIWRFDASGGRGS